MELFDFIHILFSDPIEYSSITAGEKRKQYFMINRRMAINQPLHANALQHIKINQAAVVDYWQNSVRKDYNNVPGWMYTKGVKKSQEVKEKKLAVSNNILKEYCKAFQIDKKVVIDALEFYPKQMISEFRDFEKTITQK